MRSNPHSLISILEDQNASVADRDDAAIDLGKHDEKEVEDALVRVAISLGDSNDIIVASCGESLGEIWKRKNKYDASIEEKLPIQAVAELIALKNNDNS